jgi:hypothetical protein
VDWRGKNWEEGVEDRRKRLHKFCYLQSIEMINSRNTRWVTHVAVMGGMINAYKILAEKHEEKTSLRNPRRCVG